MSRVNLAQQVSSNNKINVTDSKDEVTSIVKLDGDNRNSYLMTGEGDLVNCEDRGTLLIGHHSKEFSKKPSNERNINSP